MSQIPEGALYAPLSSRSATAEATSTAAAAFSARTLVGLDGGVYDDKLRGKQTHLDNPVKDVKTAEAARRRRGERRLRRRKAALTRAEKTRLGDCGKPGGSLRYDMFVALHKLWKEYMKELFADEASKAYNSEQALVKIVRADYHGAVFTVTQSKCKHFVGISGIMIKETDNMFYIITRENVVKGVPKAKSNFSFVHDDNLFTLYGCSLKGSAADRVTKKLRWKNSVELI
ncbi:Rof/RNase P-like protein [Obelidium mucronatum]|nr:Rof/RNase P-like protein [Obelidium mucronatum]